MLTVHSPSYHVGRSQQIRLIVLHTAQVPCETGRAVGTAAYLGRPDVRASCHYAVDPSVTVAQIAEANTAWAAPGANADGIQIEQCAYAEFGSGRPIPEAAKAAREAYGATWPGWDHPEVDKMIRTQTAPLVADICRRYGFPAVWLSAADLLANKRGVTDHNTVNQAYGQSDHWDCGGGYPSGLVMQLVNGILRGDPSPTTPPQQNDDEEWEMRIVRTNAGHILAVDGMYFEFVPGTNWDERNACLIEWARAGLIPADPNGTPIIKDLGDNGVNGLIRVR